MYPADLEMLSARVQELARGSRKQISLANGKHTLTIRRIERSTWSVIGEQPATVEATPEGPPGS
jgi:hypothetical protein